MSDEPGIHGVLTLPGRVEVECRLVVLVLCPRCGGEHRHVVGAADRPFLPGPWYFGCDCEGARFLIHVTEVQMRQARSTAERIIAQHRLSERWFD